MRRRAVRAALALLVPAMLAPAVPPYAVATGTPESTTGTASTVSPSTVAVGGAVTYTLSGFPPRAVVQVVVDDGALVVTGDASVGSVVTSEDGVATGRIELPEYVTRGSHWLRFNVTAGPDVPTSETRTLDYTNKSPYFTVSDVTVIGGTGTTPGPTAPPGDSAAPVPATGGNRAEQGSAMPGASRTGHLDAARRRRAPLGVEIGSGAFWLTLFGSVLVVSAVPAVIIRRRASRRRTARHRRR